MKTETTLSHERQLLIRQKGVVPLRKFVDDKHSYFVFKRIFDVVFSFLVIVGVLSWLVPLVSILIMIDSRGPVFFIQRRVGKGGKSFSCLKFRTMVLNKEANQQQATFDDYRITRVGSFLRKSNLDEFPQFLNVFIGHMSIVGPRPHMLSDCNAFSQVVTGYKFRNMVKPGVTGLAQVKGFRGPAKDFQSIFRRYQYDAFYIRNTNFWLDMRIIRATAKQTTRVILQKFITIPEATTPSTFEPVASVVKSNA